MLRNLVETRYFSDDPGRVNGSNMLMRDLSRRLGLLNPGI